VPKVTNPLHSLDARGQFGKRLIFTRGGVVRNYFVPRNPNTPAQQAVRQAFKENYVAGLTQEQADLLYSAIAHLHDGRYSLLEHMHDHGAMNGLDDDDHPQYFNQTRGDGRYVTRGSMNRAWLPFSSYGAIFSLTENAFPYGVTIGRSMVIKRMDVAFTVYSINDNSNYWGVSLVRGSDLASIVGFDTRGTSIGTFDLFSTESFDISGVDENSKAIFIYCEKVGSPGPLDLACPMVEVEL
jgi:hypothetical protein